MVTDVVIGKYTEDAENIAIRTAGKSHSHYPHPLQHPIPPPHDQSHYSQCQFHQVSAQSDLQFLGSWDVEKVKRRMEWATNITDGYWCGHW